MTCRDELPCEQSRALAFSVTSDRLCAPAALLLFHSSDEKSLGFPGLLSCTTTAVYNLVRECTHHRKNRSF